MSYLQYDTEKMTEVKQTYVNEVSKMEDIKSKMQKMVDDVKEGWDTEAGNAFFEKYDEEWLKGFNQYIEVLTHMSENLDMAEGKYTQITNLAKKTKLNL